MKKSRNFVIMEFSIVIGMILAFVAGAWIRKPFTFKKKEKHPEPPMVVEDERASEWEKFMNYTGVSNED